MCRHRRRSERSEPLARRHGGLSARMDEVLARACELVGQRTARREMMGRRPWRSRRWRRCYWLERPVLPCGPSAHILCLWRSADLDAQRHHRSVHHHRMRDLGARRYWRRGCRCDCNQNNPLVQSHERPRPSHPAAPSKDAPCERAPRTSAAFVALRRLSQRHHHRHRESHGRNGLLCAPPAGKRGARGRPEARQSPAAAPASPAPVPWAAYRAPRHCSARASSPKSRPGLRREPLCS